jgi:hypothetical protein
VITVYTGASRLQFLLQFDSLSAVEIADTWHLAVLRVTNRRYSTVMGG